MKKRPTTQERIRNICNGSLVDIAGGCMKLDEVRDSIKDIMLHRSPEYVVVMIEKRKDLRKYHTTIYITQHDFRNYSPTPLGVDDYQPTSTEGG